MGDVVVTSGASTDSNANRLRFGGFDLAAMADFELTRPLVEVAEGWNVPVRVGNVLSSDQFPHSRPDVFEVAQRVGVLAVEMEAAGLFVAAAEHGVHAAAILTVSDVMGSDVKMSAEDRETSLGEMISITLETAVRSNNSTSP